jgi:predicted dehydrogenase
MGEIVGVSASLQRLSDRPAMTADDTYSAHLRLENGATVVLHSSCVARGPFVGTTKIIGTKGTAWLQGEEIWADTGSGPQQLPAPEDLPLVPPDPPPSELLHNAYDMWHSTGIDLAPYTRLYERLRERALGRSVIDDPPAATFADGVRAQAVMDAMHASSAAGGRWTAIAYP